MTSSPGFTPAASNATRSASRPVLTPMACFTPTMAAKPFSNASTSGPRMYLPCEMTFVTAFSIWSLMGA